jgi:hypothetical protein
VQQQDPLLTGQDDQRSWPLVDSTRQRRHEWTVALGLLVGFFIACPTFLIEEFWHGKPLIDQRGMGWIIPAVIMVIGFLLGGAIVGHQSRGVFSAFVHGALMGAATLLFIFIVDLIRRDVLNQRWNFGVEKLWITSAVGAILVGGLGGIIGFGRAAPAEVVAD